MIKLSCGHRRYYAKGMCRNCYQRWHYKTNPEYRKKATLAVKKWRNKNREQYNKQCLECMKKRHKLQKEKEELLKQMPPEQLLKLVRRIK